MRAAWAFLVLAVTGFVLWLAYLIRAHGAGRVAWRWFSGHALDGEFRTNATWLHPATKVLHPSGRVGRWHHWPRLHRAGIRTGGTLASAAIRYGWQADPTLTLGFAVAAALVSALAGAWFLVRTARSWRHGRQWLAPLHKALAPQIGIGAGRKPGSWLEVSPDRTFVLVHLPPDFSASPARRDAIVGTVASKLAIEAPQQDWSGLAGPKPVLRITASHAPPKQVTLDDLREHIDKARDHQLVLGLGRGGAPVVVSLDGDSPHVAISMGSGAGKSALGRMVASAALHKGAILMVLDTKRISHMWARDLPNVRYCKTVEQIHDACLWLAAEVERRNDVADAAADIEGNVHADVGPRIIVLAEELNATLNRLRAYWRTCRDEDDYAQRSPAVEAIEEVLFMGRQVRVNVISIAQMMTAKTAGSGEARENMGIRILGRYSWNAWKMLVPEIKPMPPSSNEPGRVQVVTGGKARETQVGLLTGKQARMLALSGVVAPWPGRVPGRRELVTVTARGLSDPVPEQGLVIETVPAPPDLISLRDAVDAGIVSLSLAALRQRSHRDPRFPGHAGMRGLAKLYDADKLAAYDRGGDE